MAHFFGSKNLFLGSHFELIKENGESGQNGWVGPCLALLRHSLNLLSILCIFR